MLSARRQPDAAEVSEYDCRSDCRHQRRADLALAPGLPPGLPEERCRLPGAGFARPHTGWLWTRRAELVSDMALTFAGLVAGDEVAQAGPAAIGHGPQPRCDTGSPARAPAGSVSPARGGTIRGMAQHFDTSVPNIARVYDFRLGGKDNISQVVSCWPDSGHTGM